MGVRDREDATGAPKPGCEGSCEAALKSEMRHEVVAVELPTEKLLWPCVRGCVAGFCSTGRRSCGKARSRKAFGAKWGRYSPDAGEGGTGWMVT